jgi:anti-sigma28 factor (negative regulator of flagellin synthesis)
MINGLRTPLNQSLATAALNETRVQSEQKTSMAQKKEPDKLEAIKEAISKNEYKLDMSKTTQAFMKHYA